MATASQSTRVFRLEQKAFASGGTVTVQTAGQIPPGRRVLGVVFRLDLDITQPGAGQAAQLGSVLQQLIAQIIIGRRVSITGSGLHFLNWLKAGREPDFPAGFPATANGVFSRSVVWSLMFNDISSLAPDDYAIPSELWTDPIQIRFGTNAIFAATAPALGNGVLNTYVIHDAMYSPGESVIPVSLNIQSEDQQSLLATINKPGMWLYALAYREASNDAGGITNTQVSQFTSYVDGEPVVQNTRVQDMASVVNQMRAIGTPKRVESQTVPVGAACINDQPGAAAAAGQNVICDFVPLISPPWQFTLQAVPDADIGAKFEFAGTLAAAGYKIAYMIAEHRPASAIGNAAAKLGLSNAKLRSQTVNGQPVRNPRLARVLPVHLSR